MQLITRCNTEEGNGPALIPGEWQYSLSFHVTEDPLPTPPPPNKKAFASKLLLKVFISRTYRQKFNYCLQNIEIN